MARMPTITLSEETMSLLKDIRQGITAERKKLDRHEKLIMKIIDDIEVLEDRLNEIRDG